LRTACSPWVGCRASTKWAKPIRVFKTPKPSARSEAYATNLQITDGLVRARRAAASMGVVPFRTGGRGLVNRLTNVGIVLGAIEYASDSQWESGATTVKL
jgi:hypothetical protein